MIKEIKETYGEFCDSWVSKILIVNDEIRLTITCANILNTYEYETIELICEKVESSSIDKMNFEKVYGIKNALIELDKNGLVLIDLDPLDYFDYLKEDPNSSFKIKCKKISFKFVSYYRGNNFTNYNENNTE